MALKNMIKVGDTVTFGRSGDVKITGKVIKTNPKTARVKVPGKGSFDVTYNLIQKAAPKRAASKRAAPKRVAPKRAAPKRVAPKKATSKFKKGDRVSFQEMYIVPGTLSRFGKRTEKGTVRVVHKDGSVSVTRDNRAGGIVVPSNELKKARK